MPAYPYKCLDGHSFDVVKAMADYERLESCPHCDKPTERLIAKTQLDSSAGDWNRVEWNPALGQWTKSWKHGRQIAKSRGMEEIGTEPVDKLHKKFEQDRRDTSERRWRDADRDMKYS